MGRSENTEQRHRMIEKQLRTITQPCETIKIPLHTMEG